MTSSRARGRESTIRVALSALVFLTAASCASITAAGPTPDPTRSRPALTSSQTPGVRSTTSSPTTAQAIDPTTRPRPVATPTERPAVATSVDRPEPAGGLGDIELAAPDAVTPDAIDPELATGPAPVTLDRRLKNKLRKIVAKTVRKGPVAGIQVAIRLPDGEVWTVTAGDAQKSPRRPVTATTGFAIASVTKTFVAALILQLVDEGTLSLDEPYARWLPDGPRARTVTIRELLSHRSGLHDYFDSARYRAEIYARDRERVWTYDDILGLVKRGYCKPGACYRYSNTNYVILGRIAETVEGKPLNRLLRERFFEPLGLRHTLLQPDDPTPLDAAHGFWSVGGRFIDHTGTSRVIPFMAAASVANAAGAIVSTARDLAVWAEALYAGDVLSRRSRHEMLSFLPPDDYGLGVRRGHFAGHAAVGHRGGLRGFESSFWYFPQDRVSIVLLSNQGLWLTDVPLVKIAKALFNERRARQAPR